MPSAGLRLPGALAAGSFGLVVTEGLRLRAAPSIGAETLTRLAAGDALRVLAGPAVVDGYAWYEVAGPVRHWPAVDPMQLGGWVAARGQGATNLVPRTAAHATTVAAGITDLRLADGGQRILNPGSPGPAGRLRLDWVNTRAFDRLSLRVHRLDGTLVGALALADTRPGSATAWWNGRIGGVPLPAGAYVLQLQGVSAGVLYDAPAQDPVGPWQVGRFGVVLGGSPSTGARFAAPVTPTNAATFSYAITFGARVTGLTAADISWRGSATGCRIGAPTGEGMRWAVPVSGCSQGTFSPTLRRGAVRDVVGNIGPTATVTGPPIAIDRTAPVALAPRVSIRSGSTVFDTSAGAVVLGQLALGSADGAPADFDVARSVDGAPFTVVASGAGPVLDVLLEPGHAYRFEARARDAAGNVGAWVAGPTFRPVLIEDTAPAVTWLGPWLTSHRAWHTAGGAHWTTTAGSSATLLFTGRAIAWIASRGPDRGRVEVWLDGRRVATIDAYARTTTMRALVFSRRWASSGPHILRLVVVGTPGRSRADVDAFAILR
jgi:hypothetical protein